MPGPFDRGALGLIPGPRPGVVHPPVGIDQKRRHAGDRGGDSIFSSKNKNYFKKTGEEVAKMTKTAKKPAAVKKSAAKTAAKPVARKPKAPSAAKKRESALNAAAAELIRMAEEGAVEQNYFFTTTFERYKMQLHMLERIREEIEDAPVLIEKEYVRGRESTVANPAIMEYNKTSQSANQTVSVLIKIIKTFAAGSVMGARAKQEDEEDIDL